MYFLIYCFAWVAFGGVLWGCCDCSGAASAPPHVYAPEKEFSKVGMDIYVVDHINSVDEFKKKYSILYSFDYRSDKDAIDDLTEEETMILNLSCEGKKKVVKIYNHHQDWCIHFYNLKNWFGKSGTKDISKLLRVLIKEMGTKGGNNFDYANCRDVKRWFEARRAKVRHNKNVLIFSFNDTMEPNMEDNIINTNINVENDINVGFRGDTREKMKQIVEAFKRMVSFSYCPEILFLLGDYNEKNLRNYLVQKEENLFLKFQKFFPPEGILSNKGWLVRGDKLVEDKIGFLKYNVDDLDTYRGALGTILHRYCYYHNASDQKIKDTHINVAITGWKRSGKTTLANVLVYGKVGKASNDFSSVTRNIAVYNHSDESVNFSVIDTPGIEENADYAGMFSEWLNTPAINDNGEFYVINEGVDFGMYQPVFFIRDSYLWVKDNNNNIEEQIVENYWGKGIGRVKMPKKIMFGNNVPYPEKIDVCVKFDNVFYSFCLQWQNSRYTTKKVKLNRELIHCIVHVVSPRNFSHPKSWKYSSKAPEGPLYTDEELALFEMYDKLNIPVVVAINYINNVNIAVMYLRKFFADLAISKKFVDLNIPPNDGFKSSFLSPLHSRGTVLNLGFESTSSPRSGVMRLLQVIYESITHAKHNDSSKYNVNELNLPLDYKDNGGMADIRTLFTRLNDYVLKQRFNNDVKIVLGRNQLPRDDEKDIVFNHEYKYRDIFTSAFDEVLSSCLDTLYRFATAEGQKEYWNMVKEGLADVTNNWAIGNSNYYITKDGRPLLLPQRPGAVNNLTNGWQNDIGRDLL